MGDADLYFAAMPEPYSAVGFVNKGLLLSVGAGAGNVDYAIRGIAAPYCTTDAGIGRLEESAAVQSQDVLTSVQASTRYVLNNTEYTALLPLFQEGLAPLRTLYVSEPFGSEVPGGKTIYSVEVITDCPDVMYVGVLHRRSYKEEFLFKDWRRMQPYATRASIVASGIEFKVMLFTVGGGEFKVNRITAWAKLTDRRGFHTFPGGVNGR